MIELEKGLYGVESLVIKVPDSIIYPLSCFIPGMHSYSTKYLGGHTDLVGGAVSYANETHGDDLRTHQILLGGIMVRHTCITGFWGALWSGIYVSLDFGGHYGQVYMYHWILGGIMVRDICIIGFWGALWSGIHVSLDFGGHYGRVYLYRWILTKNYTAIYHNVGNILGLYFMYFMGELEDTNSLPTKILCLVLRPSMLPVWIA